MQKSLVFEKFVAAETDSERLKLVQSLMNEAPSWQKNLSMWQLLSLLPTRIEKSRMAHNMRMSRRPSSEWAMVSHLLTDSDQDIIGNAINSMTFSKQRALGHRTVHFFAASERPQRVLYCLARFCEETNDHRYAHFLAPFLTHDLSDAFLARSFNAMFRLGVKHEVALKVASELIASHIDATNMDRKAAVAAIVYLCFAGSAQDIENLKKVRDRVTIPELRRLLNWGFSDISLVCKNNFNAQDARNFFERAMNEAEPNFSGYGCFTDSILVEGFKLLLNEIKIENLESLTRTVLALGHGACIDELSIHKSFGIDACTSKKMKIILGLWRQYMPVHCQSFENSVRNPEFLSVWHAEDPEILFTMLKIEDFSGDTKPKKMSWQSIFESSLKDNFNLSVDLLCAQCFALERAQIEKIDSTLIENATLSILKNVATCLSNLNLKNSPEIYHDFVDRMYGTVVGGLYSSHFYRELFILAPFSDTSWAFNAFALCAPDIEYSLMQKAIAQEILHIQNGLKTGALAMSDFIQEVISRLQAILVGAERFNVKVSSETLTSMNALCRSIQGILEAVEQSAVPEESDVVEDSESADWSGHVSVDKPVLRWNTIVQVCLRTDLTTEEILEAETLLREAMRVAPHVEKRWVIRALVRIGSDDAIKAVLYQALQHVDLEFVAHTVRELLPSRHPRAQQALIRCVGRNTISDELKLLILDDISLDNPAEILQELRTLEILRLPQHIDDAIRDAVGRVAAVIDVDSNHSPKAEFSTKVTSFDVDHIIKKLIPDSDLLSVDTRSALRTAEMIMIQSRDWGAEAVDLSPIVNMHCKAVELTMRETFEAFTDAIIRKGILARKLDVLGYARPIPEKMQIFEDYLASLPIIKSIPYFSKFKLRKMLRAICLYRPGKRFTLDGPKAFALLFLVASRKQCTFGLDRILELDFATDLELFEFIKLVHSLQDSRNRAVHEGLTWDAKDEIEGMRSQAYKIIETCVKLGRFLQRQNYILQNSTSIGMGA